MTNQTLASSTPRQTVTPLHSNAEFRQAEVLTALRLLGADEYDMLLSETHILPRLLEADEQLFGAVYGKYKKSPGNAAGRGMLVVTDRRVLLVDKKPLWLHYEEIKFDVLSAVRYGHVGIGTTITLSTRMGDISFRTFNNRCATQFVRAIEDILCSRPKEAVT